MRLFVFKKANLGFFLLLGAFFFSTANAQVFVENFNNGMPPGFTIIDNDGLPVDPNVAAHAAAAWITIENFDSTGIGDSVACSTSWYNPPGTSDDWMFTPVINLTANNLLKWQAKAQDPNFPDGYDLRISTTTPTIAGALANPALFTIAAENGTWTNRSVDLQAAGYMNQTVYLAWHNFSTDQFLLLIDNISIVASGTFDAEMTSATPLNPEYTQIPLSQATAFPLAGVISNIGVNAISTVTMTANVYLNGLNVYTGTTPPFPSIPAAGTQAFNLPNYMPLDTGFYVVEYIAATTDPDADLSNDTLYQSIYISDSVFARDNAVVSGALGIGAGNGGIIGQQYVLTAPASLSSVSFYLTEIANHSGQPLAVGIYDYNNGTPGTLLGTTDTIIGSGTGSAFITLMVDGGPMALPADTFFIGLIETDSTLTLGYCNDIYTPGATWVDWPTNPFGGWANSEAFGFPVAYVIRANLGTQCTAPTADFSSTPNLLTATFTDLSVLGANPGWFWDFGDGNTSTQQNPAHSYAAPGTYKVCLIVSDDCCADTLCNQVTVSCPAPQVSWSSLDQGALSVDFSDLSVVTGGSPTYLWDFGDGNTSGLQNPTHVYASPGTYTVCLTVTDICGTDSTCGFITPACPVPTASWSFIDLGNLSVDYTDLSTVTGAGVTYQWDFGDGNTSTQQNPLHTYASQGNYIVCLIVTDICGADTSCMAIGITSLSPGASITNLDIYPNPSNGLYTLSGTVNDKQDIEMVVTDLRGLEVKRKIMSGNHARFEQVIDLSDASAGVYILTIKSGETKLMRKLIKW